MKTSGYTLIELIIVLSIISVVSKIISLNLKNNEEATISNAAIVLKDEIRHLQRLSMAENRGYKLEIERMNDNKYIISYEIDEEKNIYKAFEKKELPEGAVFKTRKPIAYTKRGTTSISNTIKIGSGSIIKELTVIPASGRVEIKSN